MEIIESKGAPIRSWAPQSTIEPSALDQLRRTADLPFTRGIAVMPDVHTGVGATVGSVIAMRGAVAPSAVGVDIGCGMDALLTDLTEREVASVPMSDVRGEIERLVPVGMRSHETPTKLGAMKDSRLWQAFKSIEASIRHEREEIARAQVGTLGSGNHFIEVCKDTEGGFWVMLHSGSRNIGNKIAQFYIDAAKALPENEGLGDLSVLTEGTALFKAYWNDLQWAQMYAAVNRMAMMGLVTEALSRVFKRKIEARQTVISCHHNYATSYHTSQGDVILTRKGAISAISGQMGIIPGSMGTRSYIVRGKGHDEAYNSASHGAGRRMSRGAAFRTFTEADVVTQTAGVECRKDKKIIDELPGAYKDIDTVMENQKDLVEIVTTLRALVCVKG